MSLDGKQCRCGYIGPDDKHPCHGSAYSCVKTPAKRRLYNSRSASLAGVQMKVVMTDTFACDDCWEEYKAMLRQLNE